MTPSCRLSLAASLAALLLATSARAAIVKTVDRKFPTGKYCPLESRAAAGVDLTFVAPASTVRVRFSGSNLDGGGQWNSFRLDNVSLVAKTVFDAHLVADLPGFDDCYNEAAPPGQATGGIPNVPAYDFNAANTPELLLDLFPSGMAGWSGSHVFHDPNSTAPTAPATGTGSSGGSLALGAEDDGNVVASASRLVSGLTPGSQYVLFAWWYAASTSPLTLAIEVPCADADGDGRALCGACDLAPGQTCGDCDDTKPHCGASCTDVDGDGYCVGFDCNDAASTCTDDCSTDLDLDAVPDCSDACLDEDRDGYGTAGGSGNACLGVDCHPVNPWCNVSCVDGDADGRCAPGDCADADPAVGNEFAETNDCIDQQCPSDVGHGVIDEISGATGFSSSDKNRFSWPPQSGATGYRAVRSSSPSFPPGCAAITTSTATFWVDPVTPASGQVFHYLVRALAGCKGSFGQNAAGAERASICGEEIACGNALDDDGDAATDCADADCAGTAACRVQTFAFVDTEGDDVATDALYDFFDSATAGANDYIFFEIVERPTRRVAWCSENAAFYREKYLLHAPTGGSATSLSWSKWRRAPSTGNAWQGPIVTGQLNEYGTDAGFPEYVWCSEQFTFEPRNCIFPHQTNNCEAYDLASGACGASVDETWELTIRIASTRQGACGF